MKINNYLLFTIASSLIVLLGSGNDANARKARGSYKLTFDDGDQYIGEVLHGKPHGKGTYTWANGTFYKGYLNNGKRSGTGIMKYANGVTYEGEWFNDKPHGKGNLTRPKKNGGYYKGNWLEGRRHGYGIEKRCSWSELSTNYSTARERKILLTRVGCNYYEGYWKKYKHGKGRIKYSNGDTYEGDWVAGKRHGFGIAKFCDWGGCFYYEGEWANNHMHGKGIKKILSGSASGKVYKGKFFFDRFSYN